MTQTSKEKQKLPLTEAERQRRMKLLVYPLMVLLFAGSMWLIFAPSSADKAKEDAGKGFNIEMPAADSTGIIADKRKAYEAAEMEQRQQQRNRDLQDLARSFPRIIRAQPMPPSMISARAGNSLHRTTHKAALPPYALH